MIEYWKQILHESTNTLVVRFGRTSNERYVDIPVYVPLKKLSLLTSLFLDLWMAWIEFVSARISVNHVLSFDGDVEKNVGDRFVILSPKLTMYIIELNPFIWFYFCEFFETNIWDKYRKHSIFLTRSPLSDVTFVAPFDYVWKLRMVFIQFD